MRRITVAVAGTLSAVALMLVYPTSHNASVSTQGIATTSQESSGDSTGSSTSTSTSTSASSGSSGAKTYTGNAVQTQWGTVQVKIIVSNGKITKSEAVRYPNENGHDQEINARALPVLNAEVVTAQGASIDSVSGATVTSNGYTSSLQSALDAAHL